VARVAGLCADRATFCGRGNARRSDGYGWAGILSRCEADVSGVVVRRFSDLADQVRHASPRLGPVRLVAVDGPTGSGKTTFASRLAQALRSAGASVAEIHTDDLLDGWPDMLWFWPRLEDGILARLRRGEPGRYRRYDWHRGRFEHRWRSVPVTDVIVVDGVTSARAVLRPQCTLSVFMVVADTALPLQRSIARDGERIRGHLVQWAQDEARHFAADDTAAHVDLLVDGAPAVGHDADAEYVQLPRAA
jgi:energy-coupling factor transporter ATP-binding protein EcfA2